MTAPSRWVDLRLGPRAARAIAACLVAYGALGLVTFAALAASVAPALATVDSLASSSSELQAALERTHDAFEGFGASLVQAERSTEGAAVAARQGAQTAQRISSAMSVSIFGAQPLLPMSNDFRQQGDELTALAGELEDLAAALRRDQGDVAVLQDQVLVLRERVGIVAASWRPAVPVAPVLVGLIAWLALQAVAALVAGALLLRRVL